MSPVDGAAGVWLHDPITVTFSNEIDPASAAAFTITAEDGTTIAATSVVDHDVMTIQAGGAAATNGVVTLTLTDGITDLSGKALTETRFHWTLPSWSRAAEDGETPSIATSDRGLVATAWSVGSVGERRIVVKAMTATGWTDLGGMLGARDATLPSVTFDAQDRPIVVWSELGSAGDPNTPSIAAARWDGSAWQPLASPGDGSFASAARFSGSDPAVAFMVPGGQHMRVRRLVGDAWQPLASSGDDVLVNGFVYALPRLAMTSAAAPVLVFGEAGVPSAGTSPSVRVLRWNGAWSEVSPIPLGLARDGDLNDVAVAMHGDTIDVAYDTYSGFDYGLHVVRIDGSTWQPLGGELDVDPPADARSPALAIDADGTSFVAWRELVEGNWRGFLARWDGTSWRPVGGGAWNDDPTRALASPVMFLAGDHTPVIAWAEQAPTSSSIRVARWNGPTTPSPGLDARASITGCAFDGTQTTLSATGCFTIANGRATPHAGLIPYDVISELWSDDARKRRWIALPDGQMMDTSSGGAWTAPTGTMLIKEFAIETTPGDPRTRKVMETRFLINGLSANTQAWSGFSFRWRADGSDADLLPDAPITVDWPLDTGGVHTQSYPSRQQCGRCHNASNGPLLGVRTGQLARRFDYDGVMADQLETMAHIGAIAMPQDIQPFAAPHDPTLPLEQRVRGYLAANCAHCHNPAGERPTRDFRYETPLAGTMLCGADTVVVMGDPASSVFFQRISTRVGGMPPLATLQTDPMAIDIVGRWIASEVNCQ